MAADGIRHAQARRVQCEGTGASVVAPDHRRATLLRFGQCVIHAGRCRGQLLPPDHVGEILRQWQHRAPVGRDGPGDPESRRVARQPVAREDRCSQRQQRRSSHAGGTRPSPVPASASRAARSTGPAPPHRPRRAAGAWPRSSSPSHAARAGPPARDRRVRDGTEARRQRARGEGPGAREHQHRSGPQHHRLRGQEGERRHPFELRLAKGLHLDEEGPVPCRLPEQGGE